jgi:hypothetical protein
MGGVDRCPAHESCRAAVSRLPCCAVVISIPWQLLWRQGRRRAAPGRQHPYQQATCVCVHPGRFGVYFDIEALAKGVTIESIETGCSRFLFPHTVCACTAPLQRDAIGNARRVHALPRPRDRLSPVRVRASPRSTTVCANAARWMRCPALMCCGPPHFVYPLCAWGFPGQMGV